MRRIGSLLLVPALWLGACAPGTDRADPVPGSEPRVVSLAPSITEIIFALDAGDQLVGRTNACDYPPGAKSVPVIGAFGRPSLEQVLSSGATRVLDTALEDQTGRAEFRRRGMEAHYIACERLSDIPGAIRDIGRLLGVSERGDALASTLEAEIRRLRADAERKPAETWPTVFIELWPEPLMTVGRASFVHDLVELAGGRNVAGTMDRDYFTVDPEWVLDRNPDVILCLHGMDAATVRRAVRARAGWSTITAVRQGRIIAGIDPSLLQRPGPRLLEGVAAVRRELEKVP